MLDEILNLNVWLRPGKSFGDDRSHVVAFQDLAAQLAKITPALAGLVQQQDPDDAGVDLLDGSVPDRVLEFIETYPEQFPDDDPQKLVLGGKPFLDADGNEIWSHTLSYWWGDAQLRDHIMIEWPMVIAETPDTGPATARIIEAITTWRRADLVTAWPSALGMGGRIFPDSQSAGFAIWLPGGITSDMIAILKEDAHSVTPMNGGTLIMTAPAFFNLADEAALARLQQIDMHLMEAGLLPLMQDFPTRL